MPQRLSDGIPDHQPDSAFQGQTQPNDGTYRKAVIALHCSFSICLNEIGHEKTHCKTVKCYRNEKSHKADSPVLSQ